MQVTGSEPSTALAVPRIAFVGLGWIGLNRMKALVDAGAVEVVALADPSPDARAAAMGIAAGAMTTDSLEEALEAKPDGVVIATPNALHAEQCERAFASGAAVFCQKPLGRDAAETSGVIAAARRADRLLACDLSYRHVAAFLALRDVVRSGDLGEIYAINLTFHNAYGPDKPWFRDRALSGGGCLMDLGIHLLDLVFWIFGDEPLACRSAHLRAEGHRLDGKGRDVEDFAMATLEAPSGAVLQLACSWFLPAGRDAVISVEVYGTRGGISVNNVDGSFYDFAAYRLHGTTTEQLVKPPDAWGGRAVVAWADRLGRGERYDPDCEHLVRLAETLDQIYAEAARY
jgi:predicted dehydrogenase